MSFRDVNSPDAALAYVERLNQKWPERKTILDKIAASVAAISSGRDENQPRILELCCGGGQLGHHLLTQLPLAAYLGIDQSEPLIAAAQAMLLPFGNRAILLRADLNQDSWVQQATIAGKDIQAIVSMQSLHDLGGEAEVSRIYRIAHTILPADGIFINADLIVESGHELPDNPGRLTIERHLALLTEHGFRNAQCVHSGGGFGCIQAQK